MGAGAMPEDRRDWAAEMKRGSLELCLLALLGGERKYGFQLLKELKELSEGFFDLKEGTLYPALRRMEERGYLASEWVTRREGIPRKYYELTPRGREALQEATEVWERLVASCRNILGRR
jgi:PadR family transcriptional regulator PadR